ncbi:HEPN domain-containing protein [Candidatus Poribacteria bacterium]|nr:HEPN domain-containing protein [Candidatus Poribacteria bacterium]
MPPHLERKTILLQVANERLKDAQALLGKKRYNGAIYLGGYVMECLLKAAICVHLSVEKLPAVYHTHELLGLMNATGLLPFLKADAFLYQQFTTVRTWNVTIRYYSRKFDAQEARKFLDALKEVRQWILEHISP